MIRPALPLVVLVASIRPLLVLMLPAVSIVRDAVWLALMMPLVWLTSVIEPAPICPAPEIVLLTLINWKVPLLGLQIRLLASFARVTFPAPCSVTNWLP